jgi:DNA-binding NarL/FixJ family response regulator
MLTHITILIAHHHHVFRTIISHIVQSYTGFCVAACVDTKEKLLERTKEFSPDVIITDIALTGIHNPGTLQELVKRHSPPRVILSWRYGEEHHLRPAMQSGCAGYIVHDAPPSDYFHAIKEVMKGQVFYCDQTRRFTAGHYDAALQTLSEKHLAILHCMLLNYTNKDTALATTLSEQTVSSYKRDLKNITGFRSLAALETFLKKPDNVDDNK